MNLFAASTSFALALSVVACSAAEVGSASDLPGAQTSRRVDDAGAGDAATNPEAPPTKTGTGEEAPPAVNPATVYTGFAAGTAFRVPVSLDVGAEGDVNWEIEDASLATVAPVATPAEYQKFTGHYAMITTKKAGRTKVFATQAGHRYEAAIVIAAYTDAQLETGRARYRNDGAGARRPCASCHEQEGGADHSPTWLSAWNDTNVLSVIQTGQYEGTDLKGMADHRWELTEAERTGVVAFLRALPPRGF